MNTSKDDSHSNNVRVVVRVRPLLPVEKRNDLTTLLRTNTTESHVTLRHVNKIRGTVTDKKFSFDGILDGTASQQDTFAALKVESLVKSVIQGYNATVFAYGQTGSGKTYTMEGYDYENSTTINADKNARKRPMPNLSSISQSPSKMGIVPRALSALFHEVEDERQRLDVSGSGANSSANSSAGSEILSIRCTFVQIYNEKVLDLLNDTGSTGPGLKLRWNQERGFYAENLYVVEVESVEDALRVFHTGLRGKVMASHRMNAASSRSHCIFRVHVERRKNSSAAKHDGNHGGTNTNEGHITSSSMCFVDLAGSEKATQTGATGVTLNESIGINTSLQVLRRVITALAQKKGEDEHGNAITTTVKQHVPYRDSKLTSLLQHAIGGNSITVMVRKTVLMPPCKQLSVHVHCVNTTVSLFSSALSCFVCVFFKSAFLVLGSWFGCRWLVCHPVIVLSMKI